MELIDTHCHLDREPLARALEAVLERMRAAGVAQCVSVGTTVESSQANIALAQRYPQIAAGVGVHPHEADAVTDAVVAQIESLAGDPRVVAIGEVGLDHFRQHAAPDRQRAALSGFLDVARARRLPIILHCREAYEPLLDLLRARESGPWRGVIHCASGPPEFIRGALALGLHISFAGNSTYPSAEPLRQLAVLVPDDRLLIETDAPFLAPQPVRGRTNEPAYAAYTAECLARLRGATPEAVAALTSRNARRLFNLPSLPRDAVGVRVVR